jgi:hypothetical protein
MLYSTNKSTEGKGFVLNRLNGKNFQEQEKFLVFKKRKVSRFQEKEIF